MIPENKVDSERIKAALLVKYGEKEPNEFIQFDGFHMPDGGDCVMEPDENGYCVTQQNTVELMNGSDVRVLIRKPDAGFIQQCSSLPDFHDIAEMLRKIAGYCDKMDGTPYDYEMEEINHPGEGIGFFSVMQND